MTNTTTSQQPDPAKLLQALSSFAGRVAKTADPKEHQNAASILQAELKKSKFGA